MISYTGVNHLAMATGNMDATIRFWRDLLEMPFVAGLGRPGYRHYFFRISETDMIAFFEWPEVEPITEKDHGAPVRGQFAFDHVSIGVATEDDLWRVKDRLEAAGVWVSEVVDHGFIHSIYSFDPNGIAIEFSLSIADADPKRRPVLVDSHPSAVALEGSKPQAGKWPEVMNPTAKDLRSVYPGEGRRFLESENRFDG